MLGHENDCNVLKKREDGGLLYRYGWVLLGKDGLLCFFDTVSARTTMVMVRPIKRGKSIAAGNSGIHSVPVH